MSKTVTNAAAATLVDGDRDNPGSVAGGVERDEGGKGYHGLVGVK